MKKVIIECKVTACDFCGTSMEYTVAEDCSWNNRYMVENLNRPEVTEELNLHGACIIKLMQFYRENSEMLEEV